MRIFLLLALSLICGSCSPSGSADVAPGPDQIVRLSDAELKGLDPQKISDLASLRIAADQFEGLTRLNGRGEAEAGLASDWQVAADGLSWTFTLRPGLQFSDGSRFDAALFPKLLARLRAAETAAPARALFDNITAITATGPQQVTIFLASPDPALPALLAHPALAAIPLPLIAKAGDRWTAQRPLVTSGSYRLATWQLNDHIRLIRNPHWHEGAAPIANIIWRPIDDSLAGMRLFLAHGADIVSDYPVSRHRWLKQHHPDEVRSVAYLGSYYFAFNIRQPPFDDRRVRLALSMAVERAWIADKVIAAGNIPAWGLLPPGLGGASPYKPTWADWPRERRLAMARQLLGAAGYSADRPLKFEIRFNSSPEHRQVAVALSAMWQPLNVEASLFNSEAALHFAALRSHQFSLARSGWIADLPTPENFLQVHQTANGDGNYSGYDNPAYDRILATAIAESNPQRRQQLMREAEAILIADMPILPLYHYVTRNLVAPRISGWQDNISNVHPSNSLRIEQ